MIEKLKQLHDKIRQRCGEHYPSFVGFAMFVVGYLVGKLL